jgi:hypothetical protein
MKTLRGQTPRRRVRALFPAIASVLLVLAAASAFAQEPGAADARLFGEEFQLNAVSIEFELEETTEGRSEVTLLDAQQDVTLEMQQFTITCVRLTYSDADKRLHAYGDATQRCVVYQGEEGTESRCDHFVYHTETGETIFRGRPEIELSGEDKDTSNLMRADDIRIERDDRLQRTYVRLRSNAVLGSRSMIDRQIENPKANNPSIVVGAPTGNPKPAPLVLPADAAKPAPVIRVTEENPGVVTNAIEPDLEKIKGKRSYGNSKGGSGKDDKDKAPF